MISTAEAEKHVRAGAHALQSGDAAGALSHFRAVTESGRANAQVWLLLAHAARAVCEWPEVERASEAVLAKDTGNLRAMVLKADARDGLGDPRGASSFYRRAAQLAEAAEGLPADLAGEIAR